MRAGGGLVAAADDRADGLDRLQRGEDASPVAVRSASLQLVDRRLGRVAVGGRRHQHVAVPAKAIRPRLMPGVSSSANCLAASCAAASRVGATSVASHRQRHVDHQHHHRAVARHPAVVGGPGHRDGQQRQPTSDQRDRRQVPPPAGPRRARPSPAAPGWRTAACAAAAPLHARGAVSEASTQEPRATTAANPAATHGCGESGRDSSAPLSPRRPAAAPAGRDEPHDVGDPVAVGAQRQQRCAAPAQRRAPPRRGAPRPPAAKSPRSCGVGGELAGAGRFRGRAARRRRRRAARGRAGRGPRRPSSSWRADERPQRPLPVDRAEEVADDHGHPRRRCGRRSASMAAARSPRTPVRGAAGSSAIVRSSVCAC